MVKHLELARKPFGMVENSIFFSQKILTEKLIDYITVCNGNGAVFFGAVFFYFSRRVVTGGFYAEYG